MKALKILFAALPVVLCAAVAFANEGAAPAADGLMIAKAYATALGIIQMVFESQEQKESSLPTPEGLYRRLSDKLKEVYQEYF